MGKQWIGLKLFVMIVVVVLVVLFIYLLEFSMYSLMKANIYVVPWSITVNYNAQVLSDDKLMMTSCS
jgi:hypothetical protein